MPPALATVLDLRSLLPAQFPEQVGISTLGSAFALTITPPGSKSLTNRALLLAALADGDSTLTNALIDADDTQRMIGSLGLLGAAIERDGDSTLHVRGVGGTWRPTHDKLHLDLGNAGTATRFLAAAAILAPPAPPHPPFSRAITIDGDARMRKRPIAELVTSLRQLGCQIRFEGAIGFPPVTIFPAAERARIADRIAFGTTASSQFVSALLLIAPWLPRGLRVTFSGPITSPSYITMTLKLLRQLGSKVQGKLPGELFVGPPSAATQPGLNAFTYAVEPDASSAGYFWTAAAISPGSSCTIPGDWSRSLQNDASLVTLLEQMGAKVDRSSSGATVSAPDQLRPIEADLADLPDAAMALAVACVFAAGPSTLTGLRTLRVKETDRIAALAAELGKVGAKVDVLSLPGKDGVLDEGLRITPPTPAALAKLKCPITFDTYEDHRMAMALSLIGLRIPGVTINNPACVSKTYPTYWRGLANVYEARGK